MSPATIPGWYQRRNVRPLSEAERIGYGMGATYKEAFTHAQDDIARQLESHIRSSISIEEREQDGRHGYRVETLLTASSDVQLEDVSERRSRQKGGLWYVAVGYERLSFVQRVAKDLAATNLHCSRIDWQAPRWLRDNLLTTALAQAVAPYLHEDAPRCRVSLALERQGHMWHLAANTVLRPIPDRVIWALLFRTWEDEGLLFAVEGGRAQITENQPYRFTLRAPHDGYVSLINVFADGRVMVVESNWPVMAHTTVLLPSDERLNQLGDELVSFVLHPNERTIDLYLALVSHQPLTLAGFAGMGRDVEVKGDSGYALDRLMQVLDGFDKGQAVMVGGVVLQVEPER